MRDETKYGWSGLPPIDALDFDLVSLTCYLKKGTDREPLDPEVLGGYRCEQIAMSIMRDLYQ